MSLKETASYEARNVRDWLLMADSGAIALPNFQRSYVWPNQRIADYIAALFEDRPTGIFLTLRVQDTLSFASRTLKGVEADPLSVRTHKNSSSTDSKGSRPCGAPSREKLIATST